jgi:hypothetical protein
MTGKKRSIKTEKKKDTVVCPLLVVWPLFVAPFQLPVRDRYYNRKKSSSHLSGGWAIIITTGKKKF